MIGGYDLGSGEVLNRTTSTIHHSSVSTRILLKPTSHHYYMGVESWRHNAALCCSMHSTESP